MTQEEFMEWLREVLEVNASSVDWSMQDAADEFRAILNTLNEIT